MVVIRLPDGSKRDFDGPVTGLELAESIGRRLAKDAVAVRVDGDLWDLNRPIESDSDVQIVTREEDDGVEILRHDAAHLLAEAVKELYPETQVTIGPAIDNGFYYDFAREEPFRPEDLEQIEQRMREIVERDESVQREVWDRDEAVRFFTDLGEHYKAEIIGAIPAGESITLYRQGRFIDLCRGPHLPSTGRLGKAFRLTKLAGAYWRGDSNNAMLQRIYGTAWPDKKKLDKYLHQLEEAERRDHRRLGREMDLFHFQEEAPGSVFWHPKGWSLFQSLIDYMRTRQDAAGYREINTPELMDRSLWVKSGHVEKFGDNMFVTQTPDERVFALKPMNCPGHVQVFKQGITSYRELPLRLSEFGSVHRYEPSGALHGLMRVRSFTQDDAHIFCTEQQITEECVTVTKLILDIYRDFGFEDIRIKFADRPEKRVGADSVWDESEQALMTALKSTDLPYELNPGEGAFYGPKLEFVLTDAIGRDWQCGTVQVDLNLPDRLGASFIGEDGQKHPPVMIHRALFGSLERFTGILLEHYAGRLPLWLAPTQVVVATITSDADAYAMEVAATLRHHGIRVETDLRNEKINYKVREHSLAKVPVMFVAGKREAENHSVSIRRLGQKHQTSAPLASAVADVARECAQKRVVDGEAA
ncbi:MAG: threonine--tRNA ligase [Chromatiales bacterium]|nr:threonine--tRNA ligase [Chromatiales bacterium]MDH3893371.1 threonine--tRNA ligase [Chromatiales bacterium]MDH3931743.1 threonine--tRNA ligase [Chromatiales bacterium]MDH4014549.1 threonine--tRNA ligase [Chromatiales bacterium]